MRKVTIYVHEETNKILSKVCDGCSQIKLTEDFDKVRSTVKYSSLCKDCRVSKGVEKELVGGN
jgi:hypothetical protein